jgi:hypothetical protein
MIQRNRQKCIFYGKSDKEDSCGKAWCHVSEKREWSNGNKLGEWLWFLKRQEKENMT